MRFLIVALLTVTIWAPVVLALGIIAQNFWHCVALAVALAVNYGLYKAFLLLDESAKQRDTKPL